MLMMMSHGTDKTLKGMIGGVARSVDLDVTHCQMMINGYGSLNKLHKRGKSHASNLFTHLECLEDVRLRFGLTAFEDLVRRGMFHLFDPISERKQDDFTSEWLN